MRDLKLWQEAVAMAAETARLVRQAHRRGTTAITERAVATALSVPELIADGYARRDALDQQRQFEAARRALAALETQLTVARHAALLSQDATGAIANRCAAVGRLLTGYLTYVERQREAERDEGLTGISPAAAASPLREALDEIYCP